ncbi:cyclic nucleotide-binding domain-containing protein [Brachyspira hyodysenteriae]|uniref:cyclic nucleotide-binding domain-containing protein n=1 Tax=Brachyspira hyodysenteriae TaxID=159 RepID=UPI0022CD8A6C|nr:cyclic nucleotide-binding domain-containing protein [Brachyspira hyodysenteriae]MCZ9967179.1 cyclic nucleotide-binding domain-containing protein [Brachyspira hyodysenteriae]MCZ9992336.1 cyclic nucleotide-binding domain-containing protein [Brachyspira hyodysenteriae]MDA0000089.1 cyclic nucleotide-binding domain-containing protein [Brachyspira hyodysenteriae]MDA0077058.1 cyclic nucleotide-binding domain-containing protein [Brachyspira hyodysenteriae]
MEKYRLVKYKKGSVILKYSQNAKDCFYIISKGSVVVNNDFYDTSSKYKMGHIVGLIASITEEPYYSTIETIEDTELWEIKIENINRINNKHLINRISNYLSSILEIWLGKYYSLIIRNKVDLYNKEDILTMASIYKENGFIDASYKLCLSYINLFNDYYDIDHFNNVKNFMKTLTKSKEPECIENNSYKMYKGYCIYTELEATNRIYYIKSGKVGIYNIADSDYITRMIYPEQCIIDAYAPNLEYKTLFTTAVVLEDSIIDIITKEELIKMVYNNAELRFKIFKMTAIKVISTILKIKSIKKTELKDKLIVLIYSILKIETLFSEIKYIKLYYTIKDIKNMIHDDIDVNDIQETLKDIDYLEFDSFDNIIVTDSDKYFKEYESYTI